MVCVALSQMSLDIQFSPVLHSGKILEKDYSILIVNYIGNYFFTVEEFYMWKLSKSTEQDEFLEISTEEAPFLSIFPERVGDGMDKEA
jgi:hypothetical protein